MTYLKMLSFIWAVAFAADSYGPSPSRPLVQCDCIHGSLTHAWQQFHFKLSAWMLILLGA